MQVILQADQRPKQNHKDEILPAHPQEPCIYIYWRKNLDRCWTRRIFNPRFLYRSFRKTRSSIRSSVPSGKKNKHSSSTRRITSRRRWSDRILETKRWSSENLSTPWKKQDGRRRRQQEKISILYWSVRTRNSLPPSPSRSFRTQFHWSYTAGQCINSGRFLRETFWMCSQCTLHHKFRIETRRTTFEQMTDSILSACGSYEQRTQRSWDSRLESTASCTVSANSVEKTSNHGVLGRYQTCSRERIKVLSDAI